MSVDNASSPKCSMIKKCFLEYTHMVHCQSTNREFSESAINNVMKNVYIMLLVCSNSYIILILSGSLPVE